MNLKNNKILYSEWDKIKRNLSNEDDWNEYLEILKEEERDKKRKFGFGLNDELIEVNDAKN